MLINESSLSIIDALARIERDGAYIRLARVLDHLRACQPERVLSIALVKLIKHQGKRVIIRKPIGKLCIGLVPGGGAVFTVALGLKARDIDNIIERPGNCGARRSSCSTKRAAELDLAPAGAKAAAEQRTRERRSRGAVLGKRVDDAARSIIPCAGIGRSKSAKLRAGSANIQPRFWCAFHFRDSRRADDCR